MPDTLIKFKTGDLSKMDNGATDEVGINNGTVYFATDDTTKNGKKGTEIITDLGQGNKGIRTIERDCFGKPEKVIDECYGRQEIYTPESPIYPMGVFQTSKDGCKTYFPDKKLADFDI